MLIDFRVKYIMTYINGLYKLIVSDLKITESEKFLWL
jgi:hypothetical protein